MCCCGLFLVSCSDNAEFEKALVPSDASKPVTFTDFTPNEGSMRTRIYIHGSNFGTDPSKIQVTVAGKEAKVVGSDGNIIHAQVRKRSYSGVNYDSPVNVKMLNDKGEVTTDYTFDETFHYTPKWTVGTVFRKVDEKGNATFAEGSFDGKFGEGGNLVCSDWLIFDPKYKEGDDRLLFSSNYDQGLYQLNLTKRDIKRLFPRTQYKSMQTFTFTPDGDTIICSDDNGQASNCTKPNMYYALRSEGFRKIRPYAYGPCTYSTVCMPNGTKFYASWTNAAIYRQEPEGRPIPFADENRTKCFTLAQISQIDGAHIRLVMHPAHKYVYIIAPQIRCILRSNYNAQTNMLEYPTVVAGNFSQGGFAEGTGGAARFGTLWCGIFVKNQDYVNNPRGDGDEYDFYVTGNSGNDCIWKITPDGVATLAAGRSNESKDGQTWGYVDGDPLQEARFEQPKGLAYDETDQTWYIYDYNYHALRYMTVE